MPEKVDGKAPEKHPEHYGDWRPNFKDVPGIAAQSRFAFRQRIPLETAEADN